MPKKIKEPHLEKTNITGNEDYELHKHSLGDDYQEFPVSSELLYWIVSFFNMDLSLEKFS